MRGWARWLGFGLALHAATPTFAQETDQSSYSLFDPTPRALLRDLSTDRPDKTESPYTVDAGRFQIETDLVSMTRDRGDDALARVRTVNVAPFNLKLGLDRHTDLQLVFDSYVRETATERASGVRRRRDGVGDLTVRLKRNLWGNDGGRAALALMPFVKLPTNSNGLGNDAVEFGLIVPLAIGVSEGVGIGLMTEVDMLEEADGGGLAPTFVNSATIAFDLSDRFGLYTELFTGRSSQRGARWDVTFDAGITYAVDDDLQLDTGFNLGLTEAADDLNLFIGVSRRF